MRRKASDDRIHDHLRADHPECPVRGGRVCHRRRAARVHRRQGGSRQPSGSDGSRRAARSGQAGSLYCDGAARHHRRQPRPRHVWRARAGRRHLRSPRPYRRTCLARFARPRERHRDRHPDLLPHRRRRDGSEVAGVTARRTDGVDGHADHAGHHDDSLSVHCHLERRRQPHPQSVRRSPPGRDTGPVLHAGGVAAHRAGERGARRHPGRVRPDASGALRVRRSDRERGDGSPRAYHRDSGGQHAGQGSRRARPDATHAISDLRRRPRSHRRHDPHQGRAARPARRTR